jgi:hypothetical protein
MKEFFQRNWVRYAALVLALVLFTTLGSHIAFVHGDHIAAQWTSTLQPSLVLVQPKGTHFCSSLSNKNGIDQRLEQDYVEVRGRMQHHLNILRYFYANYFRAVTMGSLLGAIAGICLFTLQTEAGTTPTILSWLFSLLRPSLEHFFCHI